MFGRTILSLFFGALSLTTVGAEGLYSKGSAVLQVDAKSYDKLIARSNQVSASIFKYYDDLLANDMY